MTDQKLKIDFANPVLIDLDGTRWIADRYVAIRCDATDLTTEELDELPMSRSIDRTKRPYSASIQQTDGPIGPNLAALLWVNRDVRGIMLTVHDSDKPGMYAICLDGDMIGFATVSVPVGDEVWTPTVDQLPKAFAVAREISRYVWDLDPSLWETRNSAGTMAAAYGAIMACYAEDPSHD